MGCLRFFGVKPVRDSRRSGSRGHFQLGFWTAYTKDEQRGMVLDALAEFRRRIKLCPDLRLGREDAAGRLMVSVRDRIIRAVKKHGLAD